MAEWFTTLAPAVWLRSDDGSSEANFIRRALRLCKGQRVLDCPCGAGRISVPLAERGCDVTGIDRQASFIRRARRRLRDRGLHGRFLVGDMRAIQFSGEFDAAINYFGSFGYFSDRGNLHFLHRLARAVRRGGRVLIDQSNRQWVLRHFQPRIESPRRVVSSRWDARLHRVISDWELHEPKSFSRSSVRLYSFSEMRDLFSTCGLSVRDAYGGADGSAYGRASRRLIMVGVRS